MRCLRLLCVFGASALFAAEGQSNVRVHVTDALGDALPTATIVISSANTQTQVTEDQVLRLPYGSYIVKAEVAGFDDTTIHVDVSQPEQIVVVGMKLGAIDGPVPGCSLIGRIDPGREPRRAPTRLRLLQLFGDYLVDVPISSGGDFEFRKLECGDYMLILMGHEGCIGTRAVRTPSLPHRLTVKIPAGNRASCTTLK